MELKPLSIRYRCFHMLLYAWNYRAVYHGLHATQEIGEVPCNDDGKVKIPKKNWKEARRSCLCRYNR